MDKKMENISARKQESKEATYKIEHDESGKKMLRFEIGNGTEIKFADLVDIIKKEFSGGFSSIKLMFSSEYFIIKESGE